MDLPKQSESGSGTNTHWRRRIGAAVLLLALLAAVVVFNFWWVVSDPDDPRILGAGDAWQYYGPAAFYQDYCIHQGQFPLWNPLTLCGQPFAANPVNRALYPPNLVRSLLNVNPTPWKTSMSIIAMVFCHLLFMGSGMYAFARRHGLNRIASVFSMFALVLSAAICARTVGHWGFTSTMAWVPWLLLLLRMSLETNQIGQKAFYAVCAGVVHGMLLLGGVASLSIYVTLMIVFYGLLFRPLTLVSDEDGGHLSGQSGFTPRNMAQDTGVLLLIGLFAVCIAAPLLLPAGQLGSFSSRSDKTLELITGNIPGPKWHPLQLLIIYSGDMSIECIRGAGILVLLLALFSLSRWMTRDVTLYALLLVFFFDASLEKSLFAGAIANAMAPHKMGDPGRAMVVGAVPLALLAGIGLEAAMKRAASKPARYGKSAFFAIGGAVLVSVLLWSAIPHPFLNIPILVVVFPLLGALCGVVLPWVRDPKPWAIAIIVLFIGEAVSWNQQVIPFIDTPANQYPGSLVELKQPQYFWGDMSRGLEKRPNTHLYSLDAAINGYNPVHLYHTRQVLCSPRNEERYFRVVWWKEPLLNNNYGLLFCKRPFWLARQYAVGPLPGKKKVFPPTTTVFLEEPADIAVPQVMPEQVPEHAVSIDSLQVPLVTSNQEPSLVPVEAGGDELPMYTGKKLAMPDTHSALHLKVSSDVKTLLNLAYINVEKEESLPGRQFTLTPEMGEMTVEVPLPDYDLMQVGFATKKYGKAGEVAVHEMGLLCDRSDEGGLIKLLGRTANTVDVEVGPVDGPRLLVFVDGWYPGWEATVDGQPTAIFQANEGFKAVAVPEGTSRVRFAFHSTLLAPALALAAGAFAVAAAACAWTVFRCRRRGDGSCGPCPAQAAP